MQGKSPWRTLRVYALIILPAMTLGAFAGIALAAASDKSYTATAAMFVTPDNAPAPADTAEAADLAQTQAINFADLVTREVVLSSVIDDLDLDMTTSQLSDHVSATVPLDTSVISISVSDPSAARSAEIANAVAAILPKTIDELTSASAEDGAPLAIVSVEKATVPSSPTTPRPLLNEVLGILAGLCVGVAIVAIRDALRSP